MTRRLRHTASAVLLASLWLATGCLKTEFTAEPLAPGVDTATDAPLAADSADDLAIEGDGLGGSDAPDAGTDATTEFDTPSPQDAGDADEFGDAADTVACASAATELCNGVDDDCDGSTDEAAFGCDDNNPCTTDGCEIGACVHLANAATCSDSDPCTEEEACVDKACVGNAVSCDDNNPCTDDSCKPVEGCVGVAVAATCSDADACTVGEACSNGSCTGGQALGCDDGNTCTTDSCDSVWGCVALANAATCEDGDACTASDHCKESTCQSMALVCDDGTGCTLDSCDAKVGCIFKPGPDKDCGTATLPFLATLSCGDSGFTGWKVSPGAGSDVAGKPAVRWSLDASPLIDAEQPDACSLNINDGKNLQCAPGQDKVVATADSPRIDASVIAKNAALVLRLQSAGQWGPGWKAELLGSMDETTWISIATVPTAGSLWAKVQLGIGQFSGSKFRLRLRFSGDCSDPTGSGWFVRQVSVQVDPCTIGNGGCSVYATCATSGDGTAKCTCGLGFSGNGVTCGDIDECATDNGLCVGKCTNTLGSFSCGCKPGYAGDGKTCVDIDECATKNGGCDANALCTNEPGSFSCGCKAGFSDVSTPGTGPGKLCADIDECTKGTAGCDKNATCANTLGGFKCTCKVGWAGTGKTCQDVDECKAATSGCSTNATCVNAVGSFQCSCKAGFTGDGLTCTAYGINSNPATSCLAILKNNPAATSGAYWLKLAGVVVDVQCDMVTDGGGWTAVEYAADLKFMQQFPSGFGWKWLPTPFTTKLKPAQITALQAISTDGKQTYVGQCTKVYHYFSSKYSYNYAFAFRFLDNSETTKGGPTWLGYDITVPEDGCKLAQFGVQSQTKFLIHSKKVPVVNVQSRDTGSGTKFGSPLMQNPAWLR